MPWAMADETAPDITMESSAPTTTGNGRRSSPARASSLSRRQSTNDRINDILETARVRSEAMGGGMSLPRSRSSGFLAMRVPSSVVIEEDQEDQDELDSPDETTGIVIRRPEWNYQSTTTQTSTGPRPRKSAQRRSTGVESTTPQLPRPAREEEGEEEEQVPREPWLKSFLRGFQSVELANKGSVARDHLALERTFLAWLRTSLAFASIGIAITQLFRLNTSTANQSMQTLQRLGRPLGSTFLAVSIAILFLGYRRYYESQRWVLKGKFPASRGTIMLVSLIAFAVMVASLVVVIIVHPTEVDA